MANANGHLLTLKLTQLTRQVKKLERLIKGERLNALSALERSKARLDIIVGSTHLHQGSITSDFHHDRQPRLGVIAQQAFSHFVLESQR